MAFRVCKEDPMTSRNSSLPGVLLLSESEALAALDRRALRDAGVARIRS